MDSRRESSKKDNVQKASDFSPGLMKGMVFRIKQVSWWNYILLQIKNKQKTKPLKITQEEEDE